MVKRTAEAVALLASFDEELAKSAERQGLSLSWTPTEAEHLRIVGDTVDRRVWLRGRLDNCDPTDTKNVVRLSTEIRQCDALVSRLLRLVSFDAPGARPESQVSRRSRRPVSPFGK